MSLAAGSRLDQYELVRLLGAGGMGEVWLATDTQLARSIAVKLLPAAVTTDPDRVRRFEQEARAASALNHPNVCTIHALGQTREGRHFIAMEYIDGQTLRDRLARGSMLRREALDIAVQIASALTIAHAAGVVHRDLKPENVMLRPDGIVKVLDFGLAKLLASGSSGEGATQTILHTEPGKVVGTVSYMSPEQARAIAVDARTDIWSVGVVLYEMLTGQRPFSGASSTDIMAAILDRDPAPLTRFDPDTPAELSRIVGKAMRKDPEQRYQVMKDLLLDLQALCAELVPSSGARQEALSSATRVRRTRVALSAAAVMGIALAAAVVWLVMRHPDRVPEPVRASVDRPLTRLTFDPGLQTDVTFSRDGRSIAYASDRAGNFDIWVQSLDGGEARQLTKSPAQESQPDWSSDGKSIAFRSERNGGGLFVVATEGGAERQLTSFGKYPLWSADASQIFFRSALNDQIYAVSPNGGEAPRELVQDFLRGGGWLWIAPHPDGRISAMGLHPRTGYGFYTVSRDGKQVVSSRLAKDLPLQWTMQQTRLLRFQWNANGTALYPAGNPQRGAERLAGARESDNARMGVGRTADDGLWTGCRSRALSRRNADSVFRATAVHASVGVPF